MLAEEPKIDVCVDWETLARSQSERAIERATRGQHDGEVFALEDRAFASQLRWRPVLVRVHPASGEVHVFDQQGRIIDEPEMGVHNGRQSYASFVQDCSSSLDSAAPEGDEACFYRVPHLRPMPRQRKSRDGSSPAKASACHT